MRASRLWVSGGSGDLGLNARRSMDLLRAARWGERLASHQDRRAAAGGGTVRTVYLMSPLMDRAEEIARRAIEPYRSLFRDGAEHMVDGLINSVAGELRGEAGRITAEAQAAVDQALSTIKRIR